MIQNLEYCMACLATEVKMYIIGIEALPSPIGEIVLFLNIPVTKSQTILCFECVAYVYKFKNFRSKCLRAQDVLSRLKLDITQIAREAVQNVDRNKHHLTSSITLKPIENISITDSFSYSEEPVYDIKTNLDNNFEDYIIKSEFVQETISDLEYYEEIDNFTNLPEHPETLKQKKRVKQKEYKTKKRKVSNSSDDEPLINKINKKDPNIEKNYKKFDTSYFEDYATVEFLTQEDAKKELLFRKESSNYINSAFKCEFCFRGFEAKATFDNHMKKHSSEYGEYVCDICQLRFQEQRCLCKHMLASHKRKFTCKLCAYVCFCTHQAKTHVSLHKGKKYPCKECGEIFSMPNSLLMHKRLKHVTECVCDICGDMFGTSRGLYSHRIKVHRQYHIQERTGPKCEDCNIHFATEEAWKRHLVLSSKHNVSNGCKICGETFTNSDDLKKHMRIHARKHTNRNVQFKLPAACSICNKWLEDTAEYKTHMTSQHPLSDITKKLNAEVAPFICELCGRTFKKRCILRAHQTRHWPSRRSVRPTPSASHVCSLCTRKFTCRSALNKHMKMHLNIRPHRCDICNKSFISPCDVRLHIKYVHNKVPWPKREKNKKIIFKE